MYVKVVTLITYFKTEIARKNVLKDIIKADQAVLNVVKDANNVITPYHAMIAMMTIF